MRLAPIFILFTLAIVANAQLEKNDFPQIARFYDFPSESHTVNTTDGYILTVFRIPYGNDKTEETKQRQPILLVHGLFSDADSFIMNGEERSIAFYLANQGYDVWLINLRGNYYSRRHMSLDPEEIDFWEYDMHDHYYDFSATIEYILQETEYETLSVVGHSHGATWFLISLSHDPLYFEEVVDSFIAIAPISIPSHSSSHFFNKLLSSKTINNLQEEEIEEIFPKNKSKRLNGQSMCDKFSMLWTHFWTMLVSSMDEYQNFESFLRLHTHVPSGGSLNTLIEYAQWRHKGMMGYLDYGPEVNLDYYGTTSPPIYSLEDIKVPINLFSGNFDEISVSKDTEWLANQLHTLRSHQVYYASHVSFLITEDTEFLDDLVDSLDELYF